MNHYPRTDLARVTADVIEGRGLFDEGRDGLFLAAPRRTGKTTFLREDLAPEMLRRGHAVVYVDLWSDTDRDPAKLIDEAVGDAIRARLGAVAKATRAAGVESLDLAGIMKIDTTRIGEHDGATLARALGALRKASSGSIVLMVDEAQQALTTPRGAATMTALKSARDQMNSPDDVNLRLVMTGSDRDKLARLVNTHDAPFLGGRIRDLPLLDDGFVHFVCDAVETRRPELAPVDRRGLGVAFARLGHRPVAFERAIADALNPLSSGQGRFEGRVLELAAQQDAAALAELEAAWHGLATLDRAVMNRVLSVSGPFRPFDAESLQHYDRALLTENPEAKRATQSRVQKALSRLRAHDPPLLWKSNRGEYAVADAAMQRWHDDLVSRDRWPPR